jgi:hypothetical protein
MFKKNKMSYQQRFARMVKKVKKETKWRDIFKIVKEVQKRLK